jgi:thiamine pyrophosphate-dependent acetolactate synthase large subunit-like protein
MAGPASFAAAVAEGLRQAGVHRLFGVPGGGANLDLIELKQRPGADPGAVAYCGTDFAAAARAMGVPAATATTSGQLRDQLAGVPPGPVSRGRPDRPQLLPACPAGHPRWPATEP